MIIKFTFYVLFTSFIFSAVKPEHNSTINYIHVLFEWDKFSDIEMYNLKVSLDGLIVLDVNTNNFFYIDENNIDWNNTYSWQVCDSSNLSNCSDSYTFSTGSEIDLGELNLTIANSEKYSDGVTVFGHIDDPFSAAIDKDGNQIWNSGGLNTFCYFNYDQNGSFYGGKSTLGTNGVPGIEADINGNILFEEPDVNSILGLPALTTILQHEIIKINDTQYLFIIPEDVLHPVSLCSTTPGCTDPDGIYSWEEDYLDIGGYHYWRGESLVLWDTEIDNVAWRWSAFENIPMDDFDELKSWTSQLSNISYDWTHFNALEYDPDENAVYLSSRHLSRIYKIALNSYDDINTDENETIIWSMGYDRLGNGNVTMKLNNKNGEYKGFSYQHGLQLLENGNIVTLDNGNLSSVIFTNDDCDDCEDYDGENYTRALEISINENTNEAEIVWEYTLDQYLFGDLSGNVQKLDNGNYLITTIADYGHSIEVSPSGEVVSDLQYKINSNTAAAIYRANRLLSIHPIGCTDPNACNYDLNARFDNDSCEYPVENCSCGSIDTDNDGVCDDEDACPNNSDPYQNDNDGDGFADACNDNDDDGDGLEDCWNFAVGNYPNTIYLNENDEIISNQQIDSLIAVGSCEDFALQIADSLIPNQIILSNAYPNPFNPLVKFDITIHKPAEVYVNIYSLKGELIDTIYSGHIVPGTHSFEWNGSQYPTGLYFINLTWDNNSINQKVVLLK